MAAILPANNYDAASQAERVQPQGNPPPRRRVAPWADTVFSLLAHGAAWLTLALLVGSSLALYGVIVRIHRRFFAWSL